MTHKRVTYRTIDRVLSAIEKDILCAGDDEIVQESKGAEQHVRRVRALIERQIQVRTRTVPRQPAARRRLLAELLRARPTLAPTLGATFSTRKIPSDDEVDEIFETLLRHGVLKPKKD
jgi:hypothetical protein